MSQQAPTQTQAATPAAAAPAEEQKQAQLKQEDQQVVQQQPAKQQNKRRRQNKPKNKQDQSNNQQQQQQQQQNNKNQNNKNQENKNQKQQNNKQQAKPKVLAAQMLIVNNRLAGEITKKFTPSDKSPALLALPIKFPTFAEFLAHSVYASQSQIISQIIAKSASHLLTQQNAHVHGISFGLNTHTFQFLSKNWNAIQHQVKKNDVLLSLVKAPTSTSSLNSIQEAKIEITGTIGLGLSKGNEEEQRAAFRHAKNDSMIILNDQIGEDLHSLDYDTVNIEILHEQPKDKSLYTEQVGVNFYLRRIKDGVWHATDFVDDAMFKAIRLVQEEQKPRPPKQPKQQQQQEVVDTPIVQQQAQEQPAAPTPAAQETKQ